MNKTGDNFDPYASDYDALLSDSLGMAGGDRLVYAKYKTDYVTSRTSTEIHQQVLDFGCGDGTSLELFRAANPNWALYGIDISAESVELARQKNISHSEISVFDGMSIPFQDESFSMLFAANVMHHIPFEHHERVINEFYRVLSPGGQIIIFEHNPYNPVTRKIFQDCIFDRDARMLAPGYLRKSLLRRGFLKKNITYHLFFPRHRFFSSLIPLESLLSWLPLGGQYCSWFLKK